MTENRADPELSPVPMHAAIVLARNRGSSKLRATVAIAPPPGVRGLAAPRLLRLSRLLRPRYAFATKGLAGSCTDSAPATATLRIAVQRSRQRGLACALAGSTVIVFDVDGSFALIEFPADDPDRARRFWSGLLGVELVERSQAEGRGWQSHGGGPALGIHERGVGPGDTPLCRTSPSLISRPRSSRSGGWGEA